MKITVCPFCKKELEGEIYTQSGEIIGCYSCVKEADYDEFTAGDEDETELFYKENEWDDNRNHMEG